MFHISQLVGGTRTVKETRENASLWPNLVIHSLDRCVGVLSSRWCSACKFIMVGLSPVIDCFCFFFLFSLLTIKVFNCPLFIYCLLGYSGHLSDPNSLDLTWSPNPTDLGLALLSDPAKPKSVRSGLDATPKCLGFDDHAKPNRLGS